jgi:hypothetical protein
MIARCAALGIIASNPACGAGLLPIFLCIGSQACINVLFGMTAQCMQGLQNGIVGNASRK